MTSLTNLFYCLFVTMLFQSCCTKVHCIIPEERLITLYFPEGIESSHTLTYIRLQKGTTQVVDSTSTRIGNKQWPFQPWYVFFEKEWSKYDYIVKLDEPTFIDTIYNISFNKITDKIECNDCFPPFTDRGKEEVERYEYLNFYHKGRELHKGDTVLMVKR
jgi:hypothetical protein